MSVKPVRIARFNVSFSKEQEFYVVGEEIIKFLGIDFPDGNQFNPVCSMIVESGGKRYGHKFVRVSAYKEFAYPEDDSDFIYVGHLGVEYPYTEVFLFYDRSAREELNGNSVIRE